MLSAIIFFYVSAVTVNVLKFQNLLVLLCGHYVMLARVA